MAGEGVLHLSFGRIFEARGALERAEQEYQIALSILRVKDNLIYSGAALAGLGHVRLCRQQWLEALAQFNESLDIFRRASYVPGQAQALWQIGNIHIQQGDTDNAVEALTQALSMYEMMKAPQAAQVRQELARILPPTN